MSVKNSNNKTLKIISIAAFYLIKSMIDIDLLNSAEKS